MSQRQDKYIASLLRAHHDDVLRHYRKLRAQRDVAPAYGGHPVRHGDTGAARNALDAARELTLREIAEARNVLHFHWDHDEMVDIDDWGDFYSDNERRRITQRCEQGLLDAYTCTVYVRDAAGDWDDVDCLGCIWVDTATHNEDRRSGESQLDYLDQMREALYRHRACDDFREFRQRWQPGCWVVE